MNFSCSTCLESFTPICDISTTPCGHVFHTGCITKWLNKNRNCSQCRKHCIIQQIIKLYFSESQTALDENITLNELEQKRLKLEDKSQRFDQELSAMKKLVDDKSIEISQTNQKCNKLEHEKLLMKFFSTWRAEQSAFLAGRRQRGSDLRGTGCELHNNRGGAPLVGATFSHPRAAS